MMMINCGPNKMNQKIITNYCKFMSPEQFKLLLKIILIIISFCESNMYIERNIDSDCEEELSFFRQAQSSHLIADQPNLQNSKGLEYLEQGDSMIYIQQFLNFKQQQLQQSNTESKSSTQQHKTSDILFQQKNQSPTPVKKFKKTKKVQNSPFHNYQKHLNNALKKLIIVPSFGHPDEDYKVAAREIWKRYLEIEVKTKRILHFVFNERNQHIISQSELKTYGLLEIYKHYNEEVISKAKNYLSKLAIDQIDAANLQGYLKTRKIKRFQGLVTYILNFKHELQSGYLKRRITLADSLI